MPPLPENVVGIDGSALPPVLLRRQPEDGEVQVRGLLWGVARSPNVSNDLAAVDRLAFLQAVRVALEMGVVVRVVVSGIELVNRVAASLAEEQLGNAAVLDGHHGGIARREDVQRFVFAAAA